MLSNETVKEYVESNPDKCTLKQSTRYPDLYVLKYKRKVFYDNLWDEYLENMRGTVVDKDFNPVIMPFQKIYNRNENGTDIDRFEFVTAVRKINGFMAAATYVPDLKEVVISTTGSLDSDFVDMAKEYLKGETLEVIEELYATGMSKGFQNSTWLFEICHPNDPHVIPEHNGAWLLGCRGISWNGFENKHQQEDLDAVAVYMGVRRPEHFTAPFGVVARKAKFALHEGYVVHGDTTSLKLKSPYYLTTKFFGRKTQEKLEKLLTQKGYQGIHIDEEFFPLVDHLRSSKEITREFIEMNEQQRFSYVRRFLN